MNHKDKKNIGDMSIFNDMRDLLGSTEGVKAYKDARVIDIKLIKPNPDQPRTAMNKEKLDDLAESIKGIGLMQPIVVRLDGDIYRIIAGHRRFEAWKMSSKQPIPCIVREVDEPQSLEQSLVENIQREKLDEVDEARYYRTLMDEVGYTMEKLSKRLHKSLGYIDSRLKLLRHDNVAQAVKEGKLGIFEAREIAKVDDDTVRASLLSQIEKGQLDRDSLIREVRKAAGKDFQLLKISQMKRLKTIIKDIKLGEFDEDTRGRARSILVQLQKILGKLLEYQ
ncbi:ParB/RepB/Spo0J family partition protein [Chloroflexota bacterium]